MHKQINQLHWGVFGHMIPRVLASKEKLSFLDELVFHLKKFSYGYSKAFKDEDDVREIKEYSIGI